MNLQNERNRNEELTQKTEKEISELEEQYNNLKKTSNEERDKLETEYTTKIDELNSQCKNNQIKLKESEVKYKTLEDTSRTNTNKWE